MTDKDLERIAYLRKACAELSNGEALVPIRLDSEWRLHLLCSVEQEAPAAKQLIRSLNQRLATRRYGERFQLRGIQLHPVDTGTLELAQLVIGLQERLSQEA